ncbi:MAG: S-layer protein [Methanomicrobia archaeon]|nr:S-layer protein [Methanomicrobia archaeon]
MNKKLYVSFILILLIFLPVSINSNELPEITVRVNPNFELLAVVYTLAADNPYPVNQDYFNDLMDYFGDYKDHEAVQRMKQKLGFDYRTVENFFFKEQRALLNTSDPPEMKTDSKDEFIDLLRDFAVKTDFMKFYNEHQKYYNEYYDFLYENTAIKEIPSLFNEFFGVSMSEMHMESSYSYIPCRANAYWKYKKDGSIIGYFFMSSCYLPKESSETFSKGIYWNNLMLHEFGHCTADMLENHEKLHQTFSYILDPARTDMRHGWEYITIDHSYIEPFVAWALDQIYGEPWGELLISQDCGMGLHICPQIYELVKTDYMPNRDIYPTFDSYIPRLCEKLQEIVTPYTTFDYYEKTMYTSISRGFFGNNRENKILIIYGTQNPDPTGTEHDKKVAEKLTQWFSSIGIEPMIMKDTDVTEDDLSKYNFILIGGPVANKITKKLNENLPIKFEKENGKWGIVHNLPEDTLVFSGFYDKLVKSIYRERYEDPDTGVMEAFRNPYNEGKYGVLIAGNGREGTDNAIKQRILYSLSCSYHIGDKEKVYEQGFYRD